MKTVPGPQKALSNAYVLTIEGGKEGCGFDYECY